MGMDNKHIGYLYLVDWNARIRWAACGYAAQPLAETQLETGERTGQGQVEQGRVQSSSSSSSSSPPLPKRMEGEVPGLLACIGVLLDRYKSSNGIA
jgi:ATP10 protein